MWCSGRGQIHVHVHVPGPRTCFNTGNFLHDMFYTREWPASGRQRPLGSRPPRFRSQSCPSPPQWTHFFKSTPQSARVDFGRPSIRAPRSPTAALPTLTSLGSSQCFARLEWWTSSSKTRWRRSCGRASLVMCGCPTLRRNRKRTPLDRRFTQLRTPLTRSSPLSTASRTKWSTRSSTILLTRPG